LILLDGFCFRSVLRSVGLGSGPWNESGAADGIIQLFGPIFWHYVIVPNVTIPNATIPNVTIPNVTIPNITILNVTIPNVTIPNVTIPNVTIPNVTIPNVTILNVTIPNVTIPNVTIPKLVKIPNININPAIPPSKLGEGEVLSSYPDLT
jgi:hypothetical protein